LVAFDYRMPEAQDAGTPGFALYRGPICAGTHIGEVDLTEYAPPAPGSLTTQCVKGAFPSLPSALTVRSLHPKGQVSNVRVVASCECPRALKQWTSCGLTATPMCQ
jgi:hypothetical protein